VIFVAIGIVDYVRCKKRGWGENSKDAKWGKKLR